MIRFSCEVTDPHTEALLRFLDDLLGDNETHKLEVLSCARQWLEVNTPGKAGGIDYVSRSKRLERG